MSRGHSYLLAIRILTFYMVGALAFYDTVGLEFGGCLFYLLFGIHRVAKALQ